MLGSENAIISIHPHRWAASAMEYVVKAAVFKTVKTAARIMMKIPIVKKLMGKYYYLAKKI